MRRYSFILKVKLIFEDLLCTELQDTKGTTSMCFPLSLCFVGRRFCTVDRY